MINLNFVDQTKTFVVVLFFDPFGKFEHILQWVGFLPWKPNRQQNLSVYVNFHSK
jgi:hypothetical protein